MYHDANSDIDEPEGEWSISQASLLLSQFLCGSGLSSPVLWWLEGSGQNAGSSPVGSSPGPGSTTHESQEGDGSAGFLISPFALWVSAGICNNGYLYVLLRHPFTPPTAIASSPATPHAELCTRACALTHSGMQARASRQGLPTQRVRSAEAFVHVSIIIQHEHWCAKVYGAEAFQS